MSNLVVAKEIARQLGNSALMMMGVKQIVGMENGLIMKIGRNAKNVNYVQIKLNGMDLYDVEFINMRAGVRTVKSEANGIYNDMLKGALEAGTGMYLSL